MRARPLDPDARRESLLAAAKRVFADRGYHAAGVADIIEAAGVARGTFYNYFESKRAVFDAVLAEGMAEAAGAVQPIDIQQDIAAQVRENVRRLVTALVEDRAFSRILLGEAAGVDAEGREALADFYGTALQRIERALRAGQALGVVRAGDVGLMARCLLGLLKEPVFLALLRGEELDSAALAKEIFAIVTGGVLR
jgi:AcrR family transcriptional regulator